MRFRWFGIVPLGFVFGFALVLVRGKPVLASDQGVYLSVAPRILDGDHLADDREQGPAVLRHRRGRPWIGGWRGPFLLEGVWREFVANAAQLLESRYMLVVTKPPGFQVWKMRNA